MIGTVMRSGAIEARTANCSRNIATRLCPLALWFLFFTLDRHRVYGSVSKLASDFKKQSGLAYLARTCEQLNTPRRRIRLCKMRKAQLMDYLCHPFSLNYP